jgi:hypothetical protein
MIAALVPFANRSGIGRYVNVSTLRIFSSNAP